AWGEWVHRWTAEEGRHAMCIRDYLLVTRGTDPVVLERDRMATMQAGYRADEKDALRRLAYVSFQELATRIAHRNTGRATGCPVAEQLLSRIAVDENLHMVFYRNLLKAALELSPNATMRAITDVVKTFEMPGADIPGFQRKAVQIAVEGIYDLRQHRDEVVMPVLRFCKVFEVEGLSTEGEQARDELSTLLADLDKSASRFEDRRDTLKARMAARS
ncbi:MAG TPA: acyl-ACP desaturase, partial [Nocardioidaceae bacterium]|nr:acyl-ACP desaturase [Nocardioidaceae bacterium]